MIKFFFYLTLNLFLSTFSFSKDIDIQKNIRISFKCELEKKIIKNSEYNYQIFLAKDLDDKDLEKFEIISKQPEKLLINGLSLFLSQSEKLDVKIVSKDIVLFKSIDKKKNYSESGIITFKSGELIHEITRNLNSENSEKDIIFYLCKKKEAKV